MTHQLARAALLILVACDPVVDPTTVPEADRRHVIALGSQLLDTRLTPADDPRAAPGDPGYALVKFPGPVTTAQLAALSTIAHVYTYLPHDTFLVRPLAGATTGLATAIGASWTGGYRPEYKLSRRAGELAARAEVETYTVMATVYPDADLSRVVAAARLPGVTVVGAEPGARASRVRLRIDGAALAEATAALAALADVQWIDVEGRRELLNDTTVWVAQSGLDANQTTPIFDHGIHGEGQVVGYIDTGIDADSCYHRDPALGLPPVNACGGTAIDPAQRKVLGVDFLWQAECDGGIASNEWDTQGHGTHVAGTIAGDNFASPIAHDPGDGMAPAAKLIVQDGGFRTDNCGDLPGIGCPVVDLKPIFAQAYTQGARIHTNSWGDRENDPGQNTYSAACQDVDEFMFAHPDFLILFAAGNSGPRAGTVGSPSTAKNGISVGATLRGAAATAMAGFSSCGPTADGRQKPDLTMPGSRIVSARSDFNVTSNNCTTATMSGTSMASPGAAGMAALVRQYYTDGNYPTGSPVAEDGFTPSAALIKATMLNSTQSMPGAGPVPDACQGWGRVLLDDALFFTGQARQLIADDDPGFPQGGAGQVKTFTVTVGAGQGLRATLVWTDFPSTPAASVNLNNDLDLEVTGPSGTFRGNVLAGGQSTTGGEPDRRNNVEQIVLAAPAAGTYTVSVRAFNVPSSAQTFALVVSGGVAPAEVIYRDDFEGRLRWRVDPTRTDTATLGQWERANPEPTASAGAKQLGITMSGNFELVTGALAAGGANVNDLDGGVTSALSPVIPLPDSGKLTLSLAAYFAHGDNSSTADFLRVRVIGETATTTVIEELGSATNQDAVFVRRSVDLTAFAGQAIRISIEAADLGAASLVEAAVDDVVIERQ